MNGVSYPPPHFIFNSFYSFFCVNLPHVFCFCDTHRLLRYVNAIFYLHIRKFPQLLQEPAFQYLSIVCILGRDKCSITESFVEVLIWGDIITANISGSAKVSEFLCICPREMRACSINLIKLRQTAKSKIVVKPFKVMCAFDCC